MSYPFSGNRLNFFEPIMAVAANDTKPLCAIDIGAANATHGEFVCVVPCVLKAAKVTVTLENVVGVTTAPYVVLTKYTAPSAGGTSTAVCTITVPTSTVIGKAIYKKDLNVAFACGDVVQVKHVIGTGGGETGQVSVDWHCEIDPEVEGNNSDLSASST
jgi:hypothetical protein